MIFKIARKQFRSMKPEKRNELRGRVKVFAASETHVITHFNRHGIMCLRTIQ